MLDLPDMANSRFLLNAKWCCISRAKVHEDLFKIQRILNSNHTCIDFSLT